MEDSPKCDPYSAAKHVRDLISKAGAAEKSDEAMKFAQAALNAANALLSLDSLGKY